MRKQFEELLKKELRVLALKTRNRLGFTQREMAEFLYMSESSYHDIEAGISMCGTLTTILLLGENSNPSIFINDLQTKMQNMLDEGEVTV